MSYVSRADSLEGHMIKILDKMADAEPEVVFSSSSRLLPKDGDSSRPKRERRCSSCFSGSHCESHGAGLANSHGDGDSNGYMQDPHCHENKLAPDIDKKARRKLIIACILSLIFMVAEIVGGVFANSIAIVSDAAHLLTDLASFLISLLAIYLAARRATKRLSFGWYRAEILGAMMSIIFLWVVTGVLCYMAVERVLNQDFKVEAEIMLITAGCGVAFNLLMGLTLHPGGHGHSHGGGSHADDTDTDSSTDSDIGRPLRDDAEQGLTQSHNERDSYGSISRNLIPHQQSDKPRGNKDHNSHKANINVKAAFIHVVGDLLQSIGVLIAALIIYFKPEWKLADPICTFVFSLIVLITTMTIMRDIVVVLMEGTPRNIDFSRILKSLKDIPGVEDIHDLRIWSLSLHKVALSVHVAIAKTSDPLVVMQSVSAVIQNRFGITETTVQVEEYVENMQDCTHCKDLE